MSLMSLMSPVLCASNDFSFFLVVCFFISFILYHQTNHICLMMSMASLVLTPDPLVRTLFAIYPCIFTSSLVVVVFWGLKFLHQKELSPKVGDSLHCFGAQIIDFPSKFQNKFIAIVYLCVHFFFNHCSFSKIWSGTLLWATTIGLPALVLGVQRLAPLFSTLMVETPKFKNCDAEILTGSVARFILQYVYRF